VRIDLNNLTKSGDFSINDKERSERPAAVKEDKLRKDRKKSWKNGWKILRLIYIVSIFFIVIKKMQKIDKNFCTDLIIKREKYFSKTETIFPAYKYKRN